jgi:alkylation response protein AidB-like acyl-CoA dehydrogenase
MDFRWSKNQQELRTAAEQAAGRGLNDGLAERDAKGEFNRDGWKRLADLGIHGMPLPTEFGGTGVDLLTTVGVLERLGYACKDNGLLFSVNAHMWTLELPVLHSGTEEQRCRFLPKLCSGEWIGGNAMTEPDSGSDAFSLSTSAMRKGDRYVLNGNKTFVTNGPVADLFLVYARVEPPGGGITAFLVEGNSRGLERGSKLQKMGIRTSPMSQVFFDDCEVPVENRLGPEGAGQMLFTESLTLERSCILASAVGTMDRILEKCISYARTRKQFGRPIGKQQLVASRIIDMKSRVENARLALYKVAWLLSQGKRVFLEAALTKLLISEAWVSTAEDAIQIHGGYGYMTEYEMERELRDAIGSRLYSGTSEIQRLIAASFLGL